MPKLTPRIRFYGDQTYTRTLRQCQSCGDLVPLKFMTKRGPLLSRNPLRSVDQRIDQRCTSCKALDMPVRDWEDLPPVPRRLSLDVD